jgi:hypothetical protein
MMLLLWLGCAADTDTGEGAEPAPTVTWLVPSEGDTVAVGDVSCSLIVEEFSMVSPTFHSMGAPTGYLELSVDGNMALQTGDTTPILTLEAGDHELSAELHYTDGDAVLVADGRLCREEARGCMAVCATISLTVE